MRAQQEMAELVSGAKELRASGAQSQQLAALRLAAQLADCQRLVLLAQQLTKGGDSHATYAAVQRCAQRSSKLDAAPASPAAAGSAAAIAQLGGQARQAALTLKAHIAQAQLGSAQTEAATAPKRSVAGATGLMRQLDIGGERNTATQPPAAAEVQAATNSAQPDALHSATGRGKGAQEAAEARGSDSAEVEREEAQEEEQDDEEEETEKQGEED